MKITTEIRVYNTKNIQQAAISYMLLELGDEVMDVGPGKRTRLTAVARETAALYVIPNHKTPLGWFMHYCLHEDVLFNFVGLPCSCIVNAHSSAFIGCLMFSLLVVHAQKIIARF